MRYIEIKKISHTYKPINQQINFLQKKIEILKYWEKNITFHRSL